MPRKIADSTVRRLAVYLQFLEEFQQHGYPTVSSTALAERAGTTSAQVRKDLSFFGSFGKRGLGYDVSGLVRRLHDILGLHHRYRVIMVGAGRLAGALVQYAGFRERGFQIVAVVDTDPEKIGVSWRDLRIEDAAHLDTIIARERVEIAIIATPADAAQETVDRVVAAGVTAILNFVPVQLHLPREVDVKNVNLTVELETLAYALTHRRSA